MDEEKMDKAINACLDKVSAVGKSDEALRYSQAALNLAHAKQILKSLEKSTK